MTEGAAVLAAQLEMFADCRQQTPRTLLRLAVSCRCGQTASCGAAKNFVSGMKELGHCGWRIVIIHEHCVSLRVEVKGRP